MIAAGDIFVGSGFGAWNTGLIFAMPQVLYSFPGPLPPRDAFLMQRAERHVLHPSPQPDSSRDVPLFRIDKRWPAGTNFRVFETAGSPEALLASPSGPEGGHIGPGKSKLSAVSTSDQMAASAVESQFMTLAVEFEAALRASSNLIAEVAPGILARAKISYVAGNEGEARHLLIRTLTVTRDRIPRAVRDKFEILILRLSPSVRGIEWEVLRKRGGELLDDYGLGTPGALDIGLPDGSEEAVSARHLTDFIDVWKRLGSRPSPAAFVKASRAFLRLDAAARQLLGYFFDPVFELNPLELPLGEDEEEREPLVAAVRPAVSRVSEKRPPATRPRPVVERITSETERRPAATPPIAVLKTETEDAFARLKMLIERDIDTPARRQNALKIIESARRFLLFANTKSARDSLSNLRRIASDESADNLAALVLILIDAIE